MPISNLAWWLYISGDSDAARAALKTYVSAPRTICMEMALPNVGIGETVLVVEASPEARKEILAWRDQSSDPEIVGNLNVVSGLDVGIPILPEEAPDEESETGESTEAAALLSYSFEDLIARLEYGAMG
jgi:hypothetical protein